jgi:serine/threonine protein kinase
VLLRSEVSQPRGYITKLGDFGLAKVLGSSDAVVNVSGTGTVNHLAPELFVPGLHITTAVDAYAFGILLYELYMGGAHAYAGEIILGGQERRHQLHLLGHDSTAPPLTPSPLTLSHPPPPGLSKNDIIENVARHGMRPRFPAGAPRAYIDLAAACWAHDPAVRPPFDAIIAGLHAMLAASGGAVGRA